LYHDFKSASGSFFKNKIALGFFKLLKKSKKILCPECKSSRIWKDGIRHTGNGEVQRYICRSCGFRFSESTANRQVKVNIAGQILEELNPGENLPEPNIPPINLSFEPSPEDSPFQGSEDVGSHHSSRVTVTEKYLKNFPNSNYERRVCVSSADAKNLAEVETRKKQAAGATAKSSEAEIKGKLIEYAWWMKKQGYRNNHQMQRLCFKNPSQKRG